MSIEGILFDSGGVLIRPVRGRWNPRVDFERTVQLAAPHLTDDDFARAIEVGDRFLRAAPPTHTRDDYHRAMLDELGVPSEAALLRELSKPLPSAKVVEPYPEVLAVLVRLRALGVRLAVVSDNDATLPDLHAGLGLREFFDVYAISAVLGCTKPDPRMFTHASDALGLQPQQCLFVDDDPHLVESAMRLGYQGCAVLRGRVPGPGGMPAVDDLEDVLEMIKA